MSKWEKLIKRIRQLDCNMRFDEIRMVMESYGYIGTFPNGGSSHCTFRKRKCKPITIPVHEPIGIVYIKLVKEVVEQEENNE